MLAVAFVVAASLPVEDPFDRKRTDCVIVVDKHGPHGREIVLRTCVAPAPAVGFVGDRGLVRRGAFVYERIDDFPAPCTSAPSTQGLTSARAQQCIDELRAEVKRSGLDTDPTLFAASGAYTLWEGRVYDDDLNVKLESKGAAVIVGFVGSDRVKVKADAWSCKPRTFDDVADPHRAWVERVWKPAHPPPPPAPPPVPPPKPGDAARPVDPSPPLSPMEGLSYAPGTPDYAVVVVVAIATGAVVDAGTPREDGKPAKYDACVVDKQP